MTVCNRRRWFWLAMLYPPWTSASTTRTLEGIILAYTFSYYFYYTSFYFRFLVSSSSSTSILVKPVDSFQSSTFYTVNLLHPPFYRLWISQLLPAIARVACIWFPVVMLLMIQLNQDTEQDHSSANPLFWCYGSQPAQPHLWHFLSSLLELKRLNPRSFCK